MNSTKRTAQKRRRTLLSIAAAAALTASGLAAAPPTWAATRGTTHAQVPTKDKVTSVVAVKGTPHAMSTSAYLAGARAAGVPATQLAPLEVSPDSYSCWYWNTEVDGHNVFGNTVWSFHVQPNWCTSGYWLRSPVYTNTWGHTWPGWEYHHTHSWTKYGAGYNVYMTHQTAHFCLGAYYACVDNSYPWITDEVGPGSRTDYMHWGG